MHKFLGMSVIALLTITSICFVPGVVLASGSSSVDSSVDEFIDFSSDRSTWFFRTEGGENNVAFFDFFSPFDPTVKPASYDPLAMYRLDAPYYFGTDGMLMLSLEELRKLYAPYFSFAVNGTSLEIRHTVYDKLVVSGFGRRATVIEITKKVWILTIDLRVNRGLNTGMLEYSQYLPTYGGRNKVPITDTPLDVEKSTKPVAVTFDNGTLEQVDGHWYVPLKEIMRLMGKRVFEAEGYLHVQSENMADVTVDVKRQNVDFPEVVVPHAANPWRGQAADAVMDNYSWADYMNEVADGQRTSGWLWRGFYIPSGHHFVDADGNQVLLKADRIVPFNLFVPRAYDRMTSRMLFVLHGGTGNENTQTYRLLRRKMPIDEYAQEYNYILVSPNGWTQNPMWREKQALYSIKKAAAMAMNEFRVDPEKVFITGNSMGGKGTIEVAMRLPGMFRAMAPTAVKVTNRNRQTGERIINIEGTRYDLSAISDMPALFVQGTADSVTSFKTQIGNQQNPGAIVQAIMPKQKNATYVAVEQGSHTYAFGSVLKAIFDFFEATLNPAVDAKNTGKVTFYANSTKVLLNNRKYELSFPTLVHNDTVMVGLNDLKRIFGAGFKYYRVHSYNRTPDKAVDYLTVIYNRTAINLTLGQPSYRMNMERYREDMNLVGKKKKLGKIAARKEAPESLAPAPRFPASPVEVAGNIYVPALEMISALGGKAVISGTSR